MKATDPTPPGSPSRWVSRSREAQPYRTGKDVWSVRIRRNGHDVFISGLRSVQDARRAQAQYLEALQAKGQPAGRGPHATTLAQALSDWAVQRLPFLKSAPQLQRRVNRYLRLAELPLIVLQKIPGEAAEDAAQRAKPGRRRKRATRLQHFVVRVQDTHERDGERRIVASLRDHRARRALATARSDRVRRRLANRAVADISRNDVQELIDAMRVDGAGIGTLQQEHALLRAFFYHAERKWNWAAPARNPASALDVPKVDNARDRVMSDDEERRLLVALAATRNRTAALVIQLLIETAMRCGEPLEQARWGNLDWDRCILRLDDGKTGSRDVPLSPRAVALLHALHGVGPRRPTDRIVQLSYPALAQVWTRACERAGIYDLVLHDLRHTAATRLALRTGNVFLVQQLTGHKTLSQVMRYVNLSARDVVDVLHAAPLPPDTGLAPDATLREPGSLDSTDGIADGHAGRGGSNVVRLDFAARRRDGKARNGSRADPA